MTTLAEQVKKCEQGILYILENSGYGHAGGSLSSLQTLVALYFKVAKIDPSNPQWEDRDRIVISKAHIVEVVYSVMSERGFFPKSEFGTYLKQPYSRLQGHVERTTPGVEYSGGSLGQGLSFACGLALAAKLNKKSYKIYCLMGDAECHEGQVWEAAMFAAKYKLNNLCAIIDYNKYGDHDATNTLMNLEPLVDKWKAFGWNTVPSRDGNDIDEVVSCLELLARINLDTDERPRCLILNTVKGSGIHTWEEAHSHIVAGDILKRGLTEGKSNVSQ